MKKNWNDFFMHIANEYAKQSSCAKIKVGAIVVKDKRIISTGYNGVASGESHCDEYFKSIYRYKTNYKTYEDFIASDEFKSMHAEFSSRHEFHAEQNAITFAKGHNLEGSVLYTTYSPCTYCAKLIYNVGIKTVYYKYVYDENSIDFLKSLRVEVIKVNEETI